MLPFFFFSSFRFQSETVRFIIETMLVCASLFPHVLLGGRRCWWSEWRWGGGPWLMLHFTGFPNRFPPQTFSKPFVNGLN